MDSDRDGMVDRLDRCPRLLGTAEGAGCPVEDRDADGVPDRVDACPAQPGPAARQGCPAADGDHDGVEDATDRCPDVAGPRENQGCPDFDSDGDGLVDRVDRCPFEEESWNAIDDQDGCPEQSPALAVLREDRIELVAPIEFVGNTSELSAGSTRVLDTLGAMLRHIPALEKVRIEGHTDNSLSALDSLELSRQRAVSVRRYLVERAGIDPQRLLAQGAGRDRPIADNRTAAGRARNNRIELVIVMRAGRN